MNRNLAPLLAAFAIACNRPAAPVSTAPDGAPSTSPADDAGAVISASPPAATPAAAADAGSPDAGALGAGTTDAGALDAGTAVTAPNAPPAPVPLQVTAALTRLGGQELSLERDGVTTVDPGAAFEVTVPVHLADGRLALHDEADAMVASTGTTELAESTSRYRLVPDEPLRPGSRYTLRLDGAVTREPHGADGRAYAPVALQLKTSGERPAAPPKKKRGSRR